MLSFLDYLREARKNPKINKKFDSSYDEFEKIISDNNLDKSRLYVTLSFVNKVGINPRAGYNTPFGIYVYPYDYFEENSRLGMPYRNDATYGILLVLSHNAKTFDIIGMSRSEFMSNIDKLTEYCNKTFNNFDQSLLDYSTELGGYGEKLYRIIYRISEQYSPTKEYTGIHMLDTKVPLVVSRIIRYLGYDFVLDSGGGVIHRNEPVQGFIVNRKSIEKYFTVIHQRNDQLSDREIRDNIKGAFIKRYTKTNLVISTNKLDSTLKSIDIDSDYSWMIKVLKSNIEQVNSQLVNIFSKFDMDKSVSMRYAAATDNRGTTHKISTYINGKESKLVITYSFTVNPASSIVPMSVNVVINNRKFEVKIPVRYDYAGTEHTVTWQQIQSFVETNLKDFK